MNTNSRVLSNNNFNFEKHEEKGRNKIGDIVKLNLYDNSNTIIEGTITWEGFDESVDMWIFEIKPKIEIPNLISLFRSEEEILS